MGTLTKQSARNIIAVLLCIVLLELALVYEMVLRYRELYIGADEALAIALAEAGVTPEDARDTGVRFRHKSGEAWYDVRFVEDGSDVNHAYRIDAETGAAEPALAS